MAKSLPFILAIALLIQALGAVALASGRVVSCDAFLEAKDQLERLVEDQLINSGFEIADGEKSSTLIRWRTKRLAEKISPYHFENETYLKFLVEKIIDLKISENLRLADDQKLQTDSRVRRTLTRLILRSVIEKGLIDLPKVEEDPSRFDKFMKIARHIRHTRAFRFLVEWKLPQKNLVLTDEQILTIADRGLEGIDEEIYNAIRSDQRNETIQRANTIVVAVVTVYSLNLYYNLLYPKVLEAYEQFLAL